MSLKINIDKICDKKREKINKELKIVIESGSNIRPDKEIYPYQLISNDIYLPFSYGTTELNYGRPKRTNFTNINIKFDGAELRDEQKIVKKEAINILTETGSIILSLYTGFGKTALAINLSTNIKLKTLIIVNKIVLMNQWEESINKFCKDATVQKLTTKSKMKECDFYVMNAINVSKMGMNFFKDIGLLIIDELHLIMAETLVKSLQYISPRYVIGLSATPYRQDGLESMIEFYFGKNKIIREMNREHIVYRVSTGFKPEIELVESTGKVNWGKVIQSQSEDEDRNALIIKIICHFKERSFLVLTKRVEQAQTLLKKLEDENEYVDSLIGSKQKFDIDCRILIGIHQKTGTGFDWPKADTLLLACDIDSYFIQSLGRVFRKKDTIPIVFDLLDTNGILIKHYKNRKEVYNQIGGKIVDFNKKFPQFF
jgi:superfamily II DNA or RNA helicase